jgi:arylsulfatase A-like enzyme
MRATVIDAPLQCVSMCAMVMGFLLAVISLFLTDEARAETVRPPNIILMLADDLGYGDLGVTGSKQIPTPHLDALAKDGLLFSNAYVTSSVCAPSRAGLMTGRHQAGFGFRDNLAPVQPGHDPETIGLPLDQKTVADRLKALGYTTGLIGKWHLGERPQFHPTRRGFDEFWGWLGGAHDYFHAEPGGEKDMAGPILCNFKEPAALTYLTDDQGDESVEFIRRHKDKRFFLFTSFAAPHTPMQATAADLEKFPHIDDKLRRTYCAMVHRLDQNIGKILGELRAQGLERDTLVVFLSDNGGQCAPGMRTGACNAPLRGGKTTVLEGGIRVPMIWRWPARVAGGKSVDAVVSALDLCPTFVGAAGGEIAQAEKIDGLNLLPFLRNESPEIPRAPLMWNYTVGTAIRDGEWKLIRLPDRLPALYHLTEDPAELRDLADEQPARARDMLRALGLWETHLPNPVFREPADWRRRHLRFYDAEYPLTQPE